MAPPSVAAAGTASTDLEVGDIQGLVVSGYGRMRYARYLLARIDDGDGARRWLDRVAARVTTSEAPEPERCINVALTHAGLAALGLPDSALATFPASFAEGMAAPHRSRALGDTGPNAPALWEWGSTARGAEVHVLLMLFAVNAETMAALDAAEVADLQSCGLTVINAIDADPLPDTAAGRRFATEHFGFADGISQPAIGDKGSAERLADGEFVLGYANGYGKVTPTPYLPAGRGSAVDLGRNGTFLVFRQLEQDVAGFWNYLRAVMTRPVGSVDEQEMGRLAAKIVGRWPSGAPLVSYPDRDPAARGGADLNQFGYAAEDPHGERCPVGSHIRRSNPRDSLNTSDPGTALKNANLHRIIRRGRSYGPPATDRFTPDGARRGLLFICLCANLERQFEFIQHTWTNNPKFAGLYDETDPLIGTQPPYGGAYTIQAQPIRQRITALPNFVTTRGGAYFLLPSIAALRRIAQG